jgi:hypothetical protein
MMDMLSWRHAGRRHVLGVGFLRDMLEATC